VKDGSQIYWFSKIGFANNSTELVELEYEEDLGMNDYWLYPHARWRAEELDVAKKRDLGAGIGGEGSVEGKVKKKKDNTRGDEDEAEYDEYNAEELAVGITIWDITGRL
jgi:hypothetical protein